MQEELPDDRAIAPQVPLERVDVLEAMLPDVPPHSFRRQSLRHDQVRMDADNEYLFVVGAIENPDTPARRQDLGGSPQVVVLQFLGRGLLERVDLGSLRV